MFIFSIIIGLGCTTIALAFPQDRNSEQYYQQQQPQQQNLQHQQHFQGNDGSTPIPIISQTEVIGPDGSFNYSYETGNGIQIQEGGYLKKVPGISSRSGELGPETDDYVQVLQGSFSYTAPDGQVISLRYIADENGFQPEGAHLPTTPAIPQDILRSLNEIRNNPDDQQQYQRQQQETNTQQFQSQQQQQYQQQRNQQQTLDRNPPPAGTFPNFQDSTQANF